MIDKHTLVKITQDTSNHRYVVGTICNIRGQRIYRGETYYKLRAFYGYLINGNRDAYTKDFEVVLLP